MRKPAETLDDPFAADSRDATSEVAAETDQAAAGPKRRGWRRLAQINLLMVLVALALVSGYFAMRRNLLVPYLEQREAMDQLSNKGAQFASFPARPRWVQTLFRISDDDFQNVEMIKLEHSENLRDEDLALLHRFPHLTRLYLASTRVTDEGMKHLRYCTKLRRISLWDTNVGDAGVAELETLKDLRIIDLHRTWTTDEALQTLGKLPALEALVLDDSATSRGVAHLSGLSNLRRLDLRSTSLRADCLASLERCPIEVLQLTNGFADRETAKFFRRVPRIRTLSLSLPGASDDDLAWLGSMRNLRELHLNDLRAEGAFASHVAKMRSLETLVVSSDRLSKEAARKLLSHPKLKSAAVHAPFEPTEILRAAGSDRREIAYVSPWIVDFSNRMMRGPVGAKLGWAAEGFGDGTAAVYVDSRRQYATVETLAPLLRQKDLRQLSLANWEFAPGALASLASLRKLAALDLVNCRFDPEELIPFASLPDLRHVGVSDAPIRDEVLAAFVETPGLESLEVHLTDASAETVLALAGKESMDELSIHSTTLDDAFLDDLERVLAPRAQRLAEAIVFSGAVPETPPSYRFRSVGFSPSGAEAFQRRFQVSASRARPLVSRPGAIEVGDNFARGWLPDGNFGTVAGPGSESLWLSRDSLELAYEQVFVEASSANRSSLFFADAQSIPLLSRCQISVSLRAPYEARFRQGPWTNRLSIPAIGWSPAQNEAVEVVLDRFDDASVERLLEAAVHGWRLSNGTLPANGVKFVSESRAAAAGFGSDFRYDAETLRAVARMSHLRSFVFQDCRKPTPDELTILFASPTLEAVSFEHAGEPAYFRDLPKSRARASGKVVYDVADAIRRRPDSLTYANLKWGELETLVTRQSEFARMSARADWANQWRLQLRLEGLAIQRAEEAGSGEVRGLPGEPFAPGSRAE